MGIKCIALDLDGTTLCSDKQISTRTKKAIEQAIEDGIHVVVASGRCLDALPKSVTEISGVEYAITSNGAAVYELSSGKCLRRVTLETQAVEAILKITENREITCEVFYEGIPYANREYVEDPVAHGATPYAYEYIRSTRHPIEDIRAFIREHQSEIDGIDLITQDQQLRMEIWKELEKITPPLYITSSVVNRIEIANTQAGKHQGLAFILDRLGVTPEETAAFGDADNDVEMLSYVKYGMAVENATQKCKEAAMQIVPKNTEDGVAVGIEKLKNLSQNL